MKDPLYLHKVFTNLVWKSYFCSICLWFLFGVPIKFLWLIALFVPGWLRIWDVFVQNVWTHSKPYFIDLCDYSLSWAFLCLIVYVSVIRKSCITLQIASMLCLYPLLPCLNLSLVYDQCLFWKFINLINSWLLQMFDNRLIVELLG